MFREVIIATYNREKELHKYYIKYILFKCMRAFDVFALPTREDIWGLVINEAMAKGLPVITTDNCVAGLELVDENNGAIIPINSSRKLSGAINKILSLSNDEMYKLGQNSIEKIKGYTFESMAVEHMNIMKI